MQAATARTCILSDTACSCDLSACSLVTACRLRISDLAITLTASCARRRSVQQQAAAAAAHEQRRTTAVPCQQSWRPLPHHLPLLGHLLDLCYRLLLLLLQLHALPVQLAHRLVQQPLLLAQHLCWRLLLAKQRFQHLERLLVQGRWRGGPRCGQLLLLQVDARARCVSCACAARMRWAGRC